jgi:hypothetical protein
MSMPLPPRVLEYVEKDFSREDCEEVIAILSRYGTEAYEREPERVLLAVLDLAKGNKDAVRDYVDSAKRDYRDVLFWSEYPEESRLDTPEKRAKFDAMCKRFGVELGIKRPPADE